MTNDGSVALPALENLIVKSRWKIVIWEKCNLTGQIIGKRCIWSGVFGSGFNNMSTMCNQD